MTYNNLKLCGFSVWTRTPKGQLRVRFPQGTVNISGNEDSFIAAFFVQNCNFSDKFVSETRLKILTLSAGMDACHRFIFSGLSPRGINYSVG